MTDSSRSLSDRDERGDLGNMGAQIAHDPGGAARLIVALRAENDRLRGNISWARGMCTDMEEHWRIDEFLGHALDGMETPGSTDEKEGDVIAGQIQRQECPDHGQPEKPGFYAYCPTCEGRMVFVSYDLVQVERVIADDDAMRRARSAYVAGPPQGVKHSDMDRLEHMRNAIRAAFNVSLPSREQGQTKTPENSDAPKET